MEEYEDEDEVEMWPLFAWQDGIDDNLVPQNIVELIGGVDGLSEARSICCFAG